MYKNHLASRLLVFLWVLPDVWKWTVVALAALTGYRFPLDSTLLATLDQSRLGYDILRMSAVAW